MNPRHAVSTPSYRAMCSHTRIVARTLSVVFFAAAALSGFSGTARAQTGSTFTPGWRFVVPSGAVVPVGAQRNTVKRGRIIAAQLSYDVRRHVAITTTVGWSRTRDITAEDQPKLDVFTYDVGAEFTGPAWINGSAVTFHPFAGAGAGGRSYDYRSLIMDATHNLAGYAGAGGELGYRRVRLRLEARNYVTGFRPLDGQGAGDTRGDVVLMAGLRITGRRS